jgi:CHAT domain-containing protein/tetratricopeptide (TPR) repeat protein
MDLQQQLEQYAYLSQQGRYQEAAEIGIGICALISSYQGKKHPNFAASLHNLAVTYMALGKYADAEPLLRQAIEIRREVLGQTHPALASSLGELATLQLHTGKFAEAEQNFKRTIEIYSLSGDENNPDLARNLHALGLLCAEMSDKDGYADAAGVLLRKAIETWGKSVGVNHPNYARTVYDLSQLYLREGNWLAAEPLYLWMLERNRVLLGDEHPDYAAELSELAGLYYEMGNYSAAEPLTQRALEIRRASWPENHPDVAESLSNLAAIYDLKGQYAAAEPLFRQAIEIWERLGDKQRSYAHCLANLAGLYSRTGRFSLVEPLYRRSIEVQQDIVGAEDPGLARTLCSLGMYYRDLSAFETAEPLLKRALAICVKVLGENHTQTLDCLNNVAILCHYQNKLDEAETLFRRVLEGPRTEQQKQTATYLSALNGLGVLCGSMGKYGEAELLYRQSLELKRETVGENHPSFAIALRNLALVYASTGRKAEALREMEKALTIEDRMIGQVFSMGTESQRMAYLISLSHKSDLYLSLISQGLSSSAPAVRSALDFVLRRKAITLEALAVQRDLILGGNYPHLKDKLVKLAAIRMQIAQMELAGTPADGTVDHELLLATLKTERDSLQQELAEQVPEMNLVLKLRAADRQAVALALPEDSALIEFVRFTVGTYDFEALPGRGEAVWKPPHYLVFILKVAEPDNVELIDLGLAEPIDKMIATFRATITGEGENRGYVDQAAQLSNDVGTLSTDDGVALRETIFDPLLTAIGDRTRLLLAPDGDLTRLPFEVLPTANGRRLIDDYRISYLGVGRDVLRFSATSISEATAPMVVADPDFDLGTQVIANEQQPPSEVEVGASSLRRHSRDMDGSAIHFVRLPGTQVEGQRIAQMLDVEPRLASAALESQVKACRSPSILHLATHGFFLADQQHEPDKQLDLIAISEQSTERMGRFTGRGVENPLLRSGLVLAGVNTWLTQGTVPTEAEDGILTAEDVSGLNLLATELVVLSACETGLGEVHTGEGVFGLRRAFVIAGAKTLVMSLWKVSDLSTAILMERFYVNLLQRKLGRDESLRDAQFYTRDLSVGEIREDWLRPEVIERLAAGDEKAKNYFQRLARKPDEYRPFSDVQYWGAFICQGDPAPMFRLESL